MKVVLLGYMGCGKSTIGKQLSKLQGIPIRDLDEYIAEKENMSIPEIFERKGELYFRKKEIIFLEELLSANENLILSIGGGTPCYGSNMELINTYSISVYLKSSISNLYRRLSTPESKRKRPLIASLPAEKLEEFIAKHLFERRPFYEKASITISVDGKSVKEITEEISLNIRS